MPFPTRLLRSVRPLRSLLVPFALLAALLSALPALAAPPITGLVTNRTTNKPSAGDAVVLIRLAQGMQETTRTTTDAHGRYTLDVPDDGLHLVRVTHDKANYFQPARPGTTKIDIEVFNAAAHVKGVSTEAVVMRLQSDPGGNSLHVVENFFVKNDSDPPLTQFSDRPFDFFLPPDAVTEGSAALAPGGMPVQASPVPLEDKGHYTFLFPIRPGETRFQVSYHVPYDGKLQFPLKVSSPTDTVAVILPKSMSLTPGAGSPFAPVSDEVDGQTFVARSVTPGQSLAFGLSGQGQLPRPAQTADGAGPAPGGGAGADTGSTPAAAGGTLAATDNKAPGKGLDNPLDPEGTRDPWSKYKWWILAGLALLLAAAAGLLLRKPSEHAHSTPPLQPLPPITPPAAATNTATAHGNLLTALKEELFALETDRLQHRITEPEYLEHKAALELVLRRALGRAELPA